MSADEIMSVMSSANLRQVQHNFFNRQPPFFSLNCKIVAPDILHQLIYIVVEDIMDNRVMWEGDVVFIELLFEMKILEQSEVRV